MAADELTAEGSEDEIEDLVAPAKAIWKVVGAPDRASTRRWVDAPRTDVREDGVGCWCAARRRSRSSWSDRTLVRGTPQSRGSPSQSTCGAAGRKRRSTRSSAALIPGTRIVVRPRFLATQPAGVSGSHQPLDLAKLEPLLEASPAS
jgi:hypothetical protein